MCGIVTGMQFEVFKIGKDSGHGTGSLSVNLKLVSSFPVTYIVDTHWNCLIEAILKCTYNICLSIKLIVSP